MNEVTLLSLMRTILLQLIPQGRVQHSSVSEVLRLCDLSLLDVLLSVSVTFHESLIPPSVLLAGPPSMRHLQESDIRNLSLLNVHSPDLQTIVS